MENNLAANIKAFRKERKLTQEQLAEVLGVTTGAVYKWESGLSIPELGLLMDMADFFDTSVDVLIGYRVRENHIASVTKRIAEYCRNMNPAALAEAEKLLKKYPNSFDAVYACANVYLVFGAENHDKSQAGRALQLLEQALLLIDQNTNSQISGQTIQGDMAVAYMAMGEPEKVVELLKAHNANGVYSDSIGVTLSLLLHRPEDAEPFLSDALLRSTNSFLTAVCGYVYVFLSRNRPDAAGDLVKLGIQLLSGMRDGELSDFTDKVYSELLVLRGCTELRSGLKDEARESLKKARAVAELFDRAPVYSLDSVRFVSLPKESSVHDVLGATAAEGIKTIIHYLDDPALSALWDEVKKDE